MPCTYGVLHASELSWKKKNTPFKYRGKRRNWLGDTPSKRSSKTLYQVMYEQGESRDRKIVFQINTFNIKFKTGYLKVTENDT